jgi:DNA-binding beta-propeller fold protein YncE
VAVDGEFRFIAFDPSTPTHVAGSIAVGPDGKVYVSDSGNAWVQVFTPQGRFIRQLGSFGSGRGQFLHPFDLAVDAAGNVYVADDQLRTSRSSPAAGKSSGRSAALPAPLTSSATITSRSSTRTAGLSW